MKEHLVDDIAAARDAGIIDGPTYERLAAFLAARAAGAVEAPAGRQARYDLVHVLWYAGALIVLGAMGVFSTTAFGRWGDGALAATALAYAVVFLAAGSVLWRRNLRTPGGLLATCAVGMAPLGIYAVQSMLGESPTDTHDGYRDFYIWIRSSWLPIEVGTIGVALVALRFFRFPFLTMIIGLCLWFMSMDLTPWLTGTSDFTWEQRATVSACFGLAVIAVAWLVDLRDPKGGDFAVWLHLGGLLAFWGGLSTLLGGDDPGRAAYGLINVGLILLSVFLMRRAYAVFGAFGVTVFLGWLAREVFSDSVLFPFALSGIGVLLIAFGLAVHRYGSALGEALTGALPESLAGLRPPHARSAGHA